jgi:hypothetical protein
MHIRGVNFTTKRFGQHARTFAYGAGNALDKAVGMAHHYGKNLDPQFAGAVGAALGHDAAAVTNTVSRTKRNIASYEELRRSIAGEREGV